GKKLKQATKDPILQSREIQHPCTVNRIRNAGRSRPYLIATFGEDHHLRIWNGKQHMLSLDGRADDLSLVKKDIKPVFEMKNNDEGYGLAWSTIDEGRLLTGSCAGELHLVVPANESGSTWVRHTKFKTSKDSIEDIAWSPDERDVFITCGVDRCVRMWDIRTSQQSTHMVVNAHKSDINVVSWNKQHTHLILTGSDDCSFRVWDKRKFPTFSQLHTHTSAAKAKRDVKPYAHYQWHTRSITSVTWNPHESSSLAVSSEDNLLSFWDLSVEVDNSVPPSGAKLPEGAKIPPQLMFLHA
ncbi:glutamate-rich WD repeat-containing protein 1, partial [Reticulomyxa filosa]